MSVVDATRYTTSQTGLFRIACYADATGLWVTHKTWQAPRRVFVSARFSKAELQRWAMQKAQALVVTIASGEDSDVFGVAIDFVVAAQAERNTPHILCVDEIRFADGAARIFWDADALHIAADNIDSQARYIHRITGGSVKIG